MTKTFFSGLLIAPVSRRARAGQSVGRRIRDVEVAPDGAIWMPEDKNPGGLFRVTPK